MKTSICLTTAPATPGASVPLCCAPLTRRRALGGAAAVVATWMGVTNDLRAQPASAMLIMADAGYKRPVEALCAGFTKTTGVVVQRSYGNLQQIFAQAKASGGVDVLVGDAEFINKAQNLQLPRRIILGQGILALAWRHQLSVPANLAGTPGVRDLLATAQWSVAMPNPQQAIYGNAARQLLQAQGLWGGVQDRLKVVGTVPQVSAYLTSGDVDVGFVNLTEALAVKDQLGGFILLAASLLAWALVFGFKRPGSPMQLRQIWV
ncbi:molybdate ABC transporter substrate-binding protein [Rhodoferax antarcticus]|nr:substrate-binding domain-containing protein [Rhodoferax antarcticus]